MPYKQIDGNKKILVNERGQLREELKNIQPDYERDEHGNVRKDKWPTVVVSVSSETGPDRRLLPAEVLKTHGKLPPQGKYHAEDFEAADGDKTNCHEDNILYKGSKGGKSPYKGKPEETGKAVEPETDPDETESGEKVNPEEGKDADAGTQEGGSTGKVVDDPVKEAKKTAKPADDGGEADDGEEDDENSSGNAISGNSGDFNASEAIEIINNNSLADLKAAKFYNENKLDKPRKTVVEAWKEKQKPAES